jgi:Ca2+-binding EF-hand superfamily protein
MFLILQLELRECFNTFDSDKSGYISISELRKVCETLTLSVNEKELRDLMKLMDKVS